MAAVPDPPSAIDAGEPTHVLRNPGVVGIGLASLLSGTGHEILFPVTSAAWGFAYAATHSAAGAIVLLAERRSATNSGSRGMTPTAPSAER